MDNDRKRLPDGSIVNHDGSIIPPIGLGLLYRRAVYPLPYRILAFLGVGLIAAGCGESKPQPTAVTNLEKCLTKAGFAEVQANPPPTKNFPQDVLWVVQYGDHPTTPEVRDEPGAVDDPDGEVWIHRHKRDATKAADGDGEGIAVGVMSVWPWGKVDDISSELDGTEQCIDAAAAAAEVEPKERYND